MIVIISRHFQAFHKPHETFVAGVSDVEERGRQRKNLFQASLFRGRGVARRSVIKFYAGRT